MKKKLLIAIFVVTTVSILYVVLGRKKRVYCYNGTYSVFDAKWSRE